MVCVWFAYDLLRDRDAEKLVCRMVVRKEVWAVTAVRAGRVVAARVLFVCDLIEIGDAEWLAGRIVVRKVKED